MPQEIAATLSRSTLVFTMLRAFIQLRQSASATHAPVIEAVRVPPSACSTSQSTVIWRSPRASRFTVARSKRPIRRWISTVRPFCLPAAASRRVRSRVARGSIPYSAVTQPRPCPLSHGGNRSSSVAVTSTWVSPNLTMHEPSAYFTTPRSSDTARSSSGARRLGRMEILQKFSKKQWLAVLVGGSTGSGKGLCPPFSNSCLLVTGRRHGQIRERAKGVHRGPSRSDRVDRAECRAGPAQRALAGHISSNRREFPDDRRARWLAQHFTPDRGSTVARVGAERDGRSRATRPDICAAYFRGPVADRIRFAVLRRRLDAGRRSYRTGATVDPESACIRRQGAIGRGRAWRSVDAAFRPDPRGGGGANGKIEFAAEAHRIRAARAGASTRCARRRGRPGREPGVDVAARGSVFGAHRSQQFSQFADSREDAGGSAP